MKNFKLWFLKKEALHFYNHEPPYFNEREIWWCSVGENVGNEINGKSNYFRRPVLIVRKLSKYIFIGIPLTTKDKSGSWYVNISHGDRKSVAIVSQIRNYDYRRLDKKLDHLDKGDFDKVLFALYNLLFNKNKSPPKRGTWHMPNM